MERILGSYQIFFRSTFGSSEPSDQGRERAWGDVAADLWGVVKWIFESFYENYIICYRSGQVSDSENAREVIDRVHPRWFPNEIPLSRRMASSEAERQFVIDRFESHPKIASIMNAFFRGRTPENLSVEDFFRNHVFTLPYDQTRSVPNPEPKVAFWLAQSDLERDIDLIVNALAEMGRKKIEGEFQVFYSGMPNYSEYKALNDFDFDGKIMEEKVRVQNAFFGGETLESFAQNPGKFKARLEAYLSDLSEED